MADKADKADKKAAQFCNIASVYPEGDMLRVQMGSVSTTGQSATLLLAMMPYDAAFALREALDAGLREAGLSASWRARQPPLQKPGPFIGSPASSLKKAALERLEHAGGAMRRRDLMEGLRRFGKVETLQAAIEALKAEGYVAERWEANPRGRATIWYDLNADPLRKTP